MRRCDVSFKLTAMQKTQIKQVKVNKVQISWYAPYLKTLPALTEHEELIYTSVIIDKHSPVLLINDATRYINYENIDEIPLLENGRLYMPVWHTCKSVWYVFMRIILICHIPS